MILWEYLIIFRHQIPLFRQYCLTGSGEHQMIAFEKYLYCLKVRYSSDKLLVMCFFVSNVGSLNPSPPLPLFAYKKKCLEFTLNQIKSQCSTISISLCIPSIIISFKRGKKKKYSMPCVQVFYFIFYFFHFNLVFNEMGFVKSIVVQLILSVFQMETFNIQMFTLTLQEKVSSKPDAYTVCETGMWAHKQCGPHLSLTKDRGPAHIRYSPHCKYHIGNLDNCQLDFTACARWSLL